MIMKILVNLQYYKLFILRIPDDSKKYGDLVFQENFEIQTEFALFLRYVYLILKFFVRDFIFQKTKHY